MKKIRNSKLIMKISTIVRCGQNIWCVNTFYWEWICYISLNIIITEFVRNQCHQLLCNLSILMKQILNWIHCCYSNATANWSSNSAFNFLFSYQLICVYMLALIISKSCLCTHIMFTYIMYCYLSCE